MGHVPTPTTPPATPLFWLADRFYVMYQWWDWLSGQIKDIWLLGQYLSSPFKTIGGICRECSNRCNEADGWLGNLYIWIDGIVNGNVFLQLLAWASGHFELIRNNAWDWIRLIIAGLGHDYALFIASPPQFVNYLIRQIAPHVTSFLDNPIEFIRSQLISINSWFFYFLYYPANWVEDKLKENFWWIASFLDNPWVFIAETVRLLFPELYLIYLDPGSWFIRRISNVSDDLYWIYLNADTWIKGKFQDLTGFSSNFWGDPISYLLRQILSLLAQQIDAFADSIKDIAIKIILKYI